MLSGPPSAQTLGTVPHAVRGAGKLARTGMELLRANDLVIGAQRVLPFLMQKEAFNNLQIGVLERVRQEPGTWPGMLLAWIESGDEVLAVASRNAPKLVLSNAVRLEAIDLFAEKLSGSLADCLGWQGPVDEAGRFSRAWERLTGKAVRPGKEMRVFELTEVRPVPLVPGSIELATHKERDLVIGWSQAFIRDADTHDDPSQVPSAVDRLLALKAIYLWIHGEPVSMAAAGSKTPNGTRVNLVYTPRERRRCGYATSLVTALSKRLLGEGRRFCFLYTDLANPTSNAIYERIGYRAVGDVNEYLTG
jgi:uncharacterized protein